MASRVFYNTYGPKQSPALIYCVPFIYGSLVPVVLCDRSTKQFLILYSQATISHNDWVNVYPVESSMECLS